jgi:hypothetical protein
VRRSAKILFIIAFAFLHVMNVHADSGQDSLRSPFSIYFGPGFGAGKGLIPSIPSHGFEYLQYEDAWYADMNARVGLLWNEKFGVNIQFGQLGNTHDGSRFSDEYIADAFPGYSFLPEYSDLDFGYRYRYATPQMTYRIGREPFNITLNAGVGAGHLTSASGTAVFRKDSSNYFIQQDFNGHASWCVNIAAGAEFAYMRQLSQHWFMNTGVSLGYNGVMQSYVYSTAIYTYPDPDGVYYSDRIAALVHHVSAGVFVYFQWNTKESARAYYE